jgi:hypothetical protein
VLATHVLQRQLHPLEHRVKEFQPFLLQIPQHVFGNRRKSLSDDDVKAERRQRSRLERLRASHLLLQGLLGCVLPGDSAETDALERGPGRLRRDQKLMLLSPAHGVG